MFMKHPTVYLSKWFVAILINTRFTLGCMTRSERGGENGKGQRCVFPFIFYGNNYTECTWNDAPTGEAWCSTSTASSGHHVEDKGYWGVCEEGCPTEGKYDLNINA